MNVRKAEGANREVSTPGNRGPGTRRPYSPPALLDFGEVRELTLGASGGTLESGDPPRKGETEL